MRYQWDEGKRLSNMLKHGEDFADVATCFDWSMAVIIPDMRFAYTEARFVAYGPRYDGRVMVLIFTVWQDIFRTISYRKANARERNFYATSQ